MDNTTSAAEHEQALIAAFAEVLRAEEAIRREKVEFDELTAKHQIAMNQADVVLRDAWDRVAAMMKQTGEFEVTLPGSATDYKIAWSKPRESAKVEDIEALPEEFVKVERKAKIKEIGDHLRKLRDAGLTLPNWARLERGEPKLTWTAVKKSTTKEK